MFRKTCPNCEDNHLWPPEYHPPVCQEISETNPSPEVKESRSELVQPAILRRRSPLGLYILSVLFRAFSDRVSVHSHRDGMNSRQG
jgi:hypothetical protein